MDGSNWAAGMVIFGMVAMGAVYLRSLLRCRNKPVHVGALMTRNGISMEQVINRGLENDLVRSARTCITCNGRKECKRTLLGGDASKYHGLCPNAAFLDGLKA